MRILRIACNTLLVMSSVTLSLLLAEVALRLSLEEIDYLRPDLVDHPHLFRAIAPGSGGHDDWGFRNKDVPSTVDIVAIGDSQTYGLSATAYNSWPSWLARLSGKSVYNMGVGGYGPLEYRYLLNEYAKKLKPDLILIGLYFGNDLWDSYEFVTGFKNKVVQDGEPSPSKVLSNLRSYLSKNSVLYQAAKHQADSIFDLVRSKELKAFRSSEVIFVKPTSGETILDPHSRIEVLDQSKPEIRIGLSETRRALFSIKNDCAEIRTLCIVVLIPTKESVYWPIAKNLLDQSGYKFISKIVEMEKRAHDNIVEFLADNDIRFIDCLEAMRSATIEIALYPIAGGHPNARGYEVIARHVWEKLNDR